MAYDNPKIWGRPTWTFLFSCLMDNNVSDENGNKKSCLLILQELGNILPCQKCREHYAQHLKTIPIDMEDPLAWLVKLYKKVNNKSHMTDEQVVEWFSSLYKQRPAIAPVPMVINEPQARKIKLRMARHS